MFKVIRQIIDELIELPFQLWTFFYGMIIVFFHNVILMNFKRGQKIGEEKLNIKKDVKK